MTYGQIKMQLQKLLPGVDQELIEGWIQGRYTRILDTISWKRQEAESVIAAPASYQVGTVTATQGSNAISSDGTTPTVWTTAMNGRMIRIANGTEYYQFTYVSPTTATLDRAYEGASTTAAAYRIDQNVFLMPTTARIIRGVRPLHDRRRPLEMISPGDLSRVSSFRNIYGEPQYAVATWDNFSDPPQLQLELNPVPNSPNNIGQVLSWVIDYIFEEAELDKDGSTATLKPFARPAAIMSGVMADAMKPRPQWEGNVAASQLHEADYKALVEQQLMINAQQRGPQSIKLARHLRRQTYDNTHLSTPWQRGMPPGGWRED